MPVATLKIKSPLIVCEADGTIVYKNACSVRGLPHLRRGKNLLQNVTSISRDAFLDCAQNGHASVVRVSDTGFWKASCCVPIRQQEQRRVLMLFPILLQIGCGNALYPWISSRVLQISDGLRAIAEPCLPKNPVAHSEYVRRENDVSDAEFFRWLSISDTGRQNIALEKMLRFYSGTSAQKLRALGYELHMQHSVSLQVVTSAEFGMCNVVLVLIQLLLSGILAERATTHAAEVQFDVLPEGLRLRMTFTYHSPPGEIADGRDIGAFADLFPDTRLPVGEAALLLGALRGDFRYSIRDTQRGNLCLLCELPWPERDHLTLHESMQTYRTESRCELELTSVIDALNTQLLSLSEKPLEEMNPDNNVR